jgi:hypothetical protein
MTSDVAKPTRQALAARNRSSPGRVSGKLLVALNSMIWQACTRKEAAERAKMTDHGLWAALRRPHVRQWLSRELQVLRLSERPRNHFALVDVRDHGENAMARVAAVKALEAIDSVEAARGGADSVPLQPGLTIRIVSSSPEPVKPGGVIQHEPRDDE